MISDIDVSKSDNMKNVAILVVTMLLYRLDIVKD